MSMATINLFSETNKKRSTLWNITFLEFSIILEGATEKVFRFLYQLHKVKQGKYLYFVIISNNYIFWS